MKARNFGWMVKSKMVEELEQEEVMEQEEEEVEATIEADAEITKVETTAEKAKKAEPKRAFVKEGSVQSYTLIGLEKTKGIKELIDSVSKLVNEAVLKFSDKGLDIVSMDPANVAMINLSIPKTRFLGFEVGENSNYAVSLTQLKSCLKRASKDATIRMRFQDRAEMVITEKHKTLEYGLPLLADVEEKVKEEPPLKFECKVSMKTSELDEALLDADIITDTVNFETSNGRFVVNGRGDLLTYANNLSASVEGKDSKAKYSLEYLSKFVCKTFDKVTLQFGKNYPCKFSYEGEDGVKLSFILAPRISEE